MKEKSASKQFVFNNLIVNDYSKDTNKRQKQSKFGETAQVC